jgi:ABC-type antimicrobial peptide transport system permease subunit
MPGANDARIACNKRQGCDDLLYKTAIMFKYSLKIAWRNILRDRSFTLLNLVGLSTGLACTLLIFLWVHDERSVDQFNENDGRLFQVMANWQTPQGVQTGDNTPGLLAQTLTADMPEVEYAVPVIPPSWFDKKGIVIYGGQRLEASNQFAGKDYLQVFSYPLLQGDRGSALAGNRTILISDELARKLFHITASTTGGPMGGSPGGSLSNVIGKTVEWNQKDFSGVYEVSGVFQKPPANATAQFDIVFNYDLFLQKNPKLLNWGNNDPNTYVMLKRGTDVAAFDRKIAGLVQARNKDSKQTLFLQKYSDRYLHNHYDNGVPSGGRIEYVRLFTIIALFILIIACINFMNLSTAKAAERMKESGIKKVMGASRLSLVVQYLGESLLMATLAAGIAVLLVAVLLPRFNGITGKQLTLAVDGPIVVTALLIILLTGLVAGSYPAIYLSGFNPAGTLKGRLKNSVGELLVRKGLVVFQFTLSGVFIISVLVIYQQMQLVQTKNLGYSRDHVIYFDKGGMVSDSAADYVPGGKYEADLDHFVEQVRAVPGVVDAANFRHSLIERDGGTTDLSWPGKDPHLEIAFTDIGVGYHFIETMGVQMEAGRTYSRAYGDEKSKIIFNELAIKKMGLTNPIGKIVHLWGEDREIIGVVKDFNFQSLYENVKPCFFDMAVNQRASKIMVRIKAGQEAQTIDRLAKLYTKDNQGLAFDYRFLDDDYNRLYASERRVAVLSRYFAALAVIISGLGLFGLAAFTAQRRQKEIGIRKVVGATVGHIVVLLSADFLRLVLVAVLIAFPIAWWAMHRWVEGFAYRVEPGLAVFLVSGGAIMVVTALTISWQAIRAATANPVRSLRAE